MHNHYRDMQVTYLHKNKRSKHGGYKWLIRGASIPWCQYDYPISAFYTNGGLRHWLMKFNIKLGLRKPHLYNTFELVGEVKMFMLMNTGELNKLAANTDNYIVPIMSNSDYTKGVVTPDNEVYYLNPNVKTRYIYDRKTIPQ